MLTRNRFPLPVTLRLALSDNHTKNPPANLKINKRFRNDGNRFIQITGEIKEFSLDAVLNPRPETAVFAALCSFFTRNSILVPEKIFVRKLLNLLYVATMLPLYNKHKIIYQLIITKHLLKMFQFSAIIKYTSNIVNVNEYFKL